MTTLTQGVHHVGLTTASLADSQAFFTQCLGFNLVGEKPDYPAAFVSDGVVMITLWQASDGYRDFDRHQQVGLHHLALSVANRAQLEDIYLRIANWTGASIEFAPEPLGDTPMSHMMCQIPGDLRLELIAGP